MASGMGAGFPSRRRVLSMVVGKLLLLRGLASQGLRLGGRNFDPHLLRLRKIANQLGQFVSKLETRRRSSFSSAPLRLVGPEFPNVGRLFNPLVRLGKGVKKGVCSCHHLGHILHSLSWFVAGQQEIANPLCRFQDRGLCGSGFACL